MKASLERNLKRYEERLSSAYDRMIGSEPVSREDRGKEYLAMAGDVNALKGWLQSQAAIHGMPIARTMLVEIVKEGEKFVNDLVANTKDVTGGV